MLKHPQNYTFNAILIFPNQHVFSGEIYTMFGNRCDPIVRLANQLSAAVTRATTSTVLYKAFRHIPHFSKPLNSLSSFIRFEKKPNVNKGLTWFFEEFEEKIWTSFIERKREKCKCAVFREVLGLFGI